MTAPRLELTWPGKDQFLLVPKDDAGKPVWVGRDHPAASEVRLSDFTESVGEVDDANPYADNLLFTGDSLDVLRILAEVPEFRREYRGRVKLVYIDPPFNTGQAFEHYDDWMEHSTWLSFMRERLLLIRDLLAPNGSVWVHLDDAEHHRMRLLMDEVLGASNFVASVVWQRTKAPKNSARFLSLDADQLVVYRAPGTERFKQLPRTNEMDDKYKNPDSDPRGVWFADNLTARNPYSLGTYEVTTPSGRVIAGPGSGRYWAVSADRLRMLDDDNRIWWGLRGDNKPTLKRFLSEVQAGRVPSSVWEPAEVGYVRNGKQEMKGLFPAVEPFATPKPERLIERVLHVASDIGDVILDCFAGSGTTAAVAQKMGRRWVTAEVLPETVAAFTRPRMEKVVAGKDPGGITKTTGWAGGGGFRSVTVGPSMYEETPFGVMLADWATNGAFARAVAGQLGFTFEFDAPPFCGVRGRMRLAVLDGAVGPEEVRQIAGALGEHERVTIVAKAVLPDAEAVLAELSKGSRIRKAPRDLLTAGARRMRRRTDPAAPAQDDQPGSGA